MAHTLDAPLVVASDVHLRLADDERARLLTDVVDRLGPGVECLVLNGDIFDFCHGGSRYFQRKFESFGQTLTRAARRGVRVLFVEGNHEFQMHRAGWQGVEVIRERDVTVSLKSGLKVQVSHGDLLTDDPLYKAFRGLVKSDFARRCAFFVPGAWLDAYAMKHATVSRAQDKYRTLDHGKILAAFNRWLAASGCDHGIIGHFHVPYAERHETRNGLMLSVESWDRPNLLIWADGRFQRIHLREPGAPFVAEPVESLFKARR